MAQCTYTLVKSEGLGKPIVALMIRIGNGRVFVVMRELAGVR
jgi:hypothetical protein